MKETPETNLDHAKAGRWTHKEQSKFIEGFNLYGKNWQRIANHVSTRNSTQVRSHAQKYFMRKLSVVIAQNQGVGDKGEATKVDKQIQYGEGVAFGDLSEIVPYLNVDNNNCNY